MVEARPRSSVVPIRLLTVSILVVTVSTQPVFLLGASFVKMGPELGFGPAGLGFLTGAFFLTSAAASIPLGRLVQRIGWRTAMRANVIASGICTVAIALFARNVTILALLLLAGAAVYGVSNPAANLALADQGDPRRRAFVFGLKHAGIPGSSLLAGLAVPVLIVTAGWRSAFAAAAGLALVVLLLIPSGDPSPRAPAASDPGRPLGRPLTTRQLAVLAASSAFATWGPVGLGIYLVAAAVDRGLSPSAAGLLLFAGSAVSIAARIVAGAITDRRRGRGFAGVAILTAVGAVVFALMTTDSVAAFAVLAVVAFATGWGWPGLMTYTVVNANIGTVAASSAITQAGVFLGAGIGPFAIGWVVGLHGFDAAWILAAAGLVMCAAGVTTVALRTRPS